MRKSSVSHQLTKTARRLSTALAPQLTKIDTVFVLQQYTRLYIRISCIEKLQEAIKQYVFHSGKLFNPVEFEVRTSDGTPILVAQFSAEDIDLFEGQKRLLSISINNPTETNLFTRFAAENSSPTEAPVLAKVRHPYSGFKLFEVSQDVLRGRHESWQITGTMDELNKCQILSHTNAWRQMLNFCGFVFAAEWWSIEHDERRVGQIAPQKSLWEENSLCIEWNEDTSNELRVLIVCFGLIQMVREAFPSLMHIVCETRQRKMNIQPTASTTE